MNAVRVEVLPVRPPDGRVEQVAGRQRQRVAPRCRSSLRPSRNTGTAPSAMASDCAKNSTPALGNSQYTGTSRTQDERRVVAHQVAAHQRDERCLEPRHQPDALVVQPEVVRRRAEAVVHVEGDLGEVASCTRRRARRGPTATRFIAANAVERGPRARARAAGAHRCGRSLSASCRPRNP